MATNSLSIKPNNHRIHPVSLEKKTALVTFLLEQNSAENILLCVSDTALLADELQKRSTLTISQDKDLDTLADASFSLVISYDIPLDPQLYLNRIKKANHKALLLLASQEQNMLYPIETLLGRVIKQEPLDGFSDLVKTAEFKKEYKPKEHFKKEKKPNKYLGKDANGKALFSGKSGERNHYYDGTPKEKNTKLTGKTIQVKVKKKENK